MLNEVIGEMAIVLIDYDFLPIRCSLEVSHHIKDSSTLVESKLLEQSKGNQRAK